MKLKISVIAIFVFIFYLSANSQIKFIENFDYTAGDSIGGHGWNPNTGSVNNVLIVSPGLTYSGYPLSGVGNAARISNNGIDYYKNFIGDSISSGTIYASFMVKIDTGKTGDYFFALLPLTSTTNYFARVFAKDSSGSISFGVSKYSINATIPATYGPNGFSYGTSYLVVVKYKFNSSTMDDEVSLNVFTSPTLPSTEPTSPYIGPITSSTQIDAVSIGRIALRQGSASSAPSLTIDGIKASTTWNGIIAGIKNISTVADKFSLSQNYPNPFNPTTNIKFSVPSNGFVKLSVYNAIGQQVQSLINNELSTGEYSVQLNGANLTSGMYFYKLELNSNDGKYFSDVKKLMLVK